MLIYVENLKHVNSQCSPTFSLGKLLTEKIQSLEENFEV